MTTESRPAPSLSRAIGGPIFIVGLARSGTKLLRDILNNHPALFLLPAETNFMPYFVSRFGSIERPLAESDRRHFKAHFYNGTFCSGMRERGFELDEAMLDDALRGSTWEQVFTAIALGFLDQTAETPAFWGDKTPTHLPHLAMLKREFPGCKFIHIIRDPRDRALSAHRSWGANVFLSCEKWRRQVGRARTTGRDLAGDYCEITYEHLLQAPEREIARMCEFLGVPFDPAMLTLKAPVENRRRANPDTTTALNVVSDNTRKFVREFSAREIARMQRIVLPVAAELGYDLITHPQSFRPLSRGETAYYDLLDSINSARHFIQRWGWRRGVAFGFERLAMKRSNRDTGAAGDP